VLNEILQERVAPRGHRRNQRGVKRKMSNFPLRRRTDKPLPPINIEKAVRVLKSTVLRLAEVNPVEAATTPVVSVRSLLPQAPATWPPA